MPRGLGFAVTSHPQVRKDAWLFGEAQSRVVVSVTAEKSADFERFLQSENAAFEVLGTVHGSTVVVDGEDWGAVTDWQRVYDSVLSEVMG